MTLAMEFTVYFTTKNRFSVLFCFAAVLGIFTLSHLFVDLMLLYSYRHVKPVAYLGLGGKAVQCIWRWQLHVTASKKLGTLDSSKLSHRAAVDCILNVSPKVSCVEGLILSS